jgi:hypothetical protein
LGHVLSADLIEGLRQRRQAGEVALKACAIDQDNSALRALTAEMLGVDGRGEAVAITRPHEFDEGRA